MIHKTAVLGIGQWNHVVISDLKDKTTSNLDNEYDTYDLDRREDIKTLANKSIIYGNIFHVNTIQALTVITKIDTTCYRKQEKQERMNYAISS